MTRPGRSNIFLKVVLLNHHKFGHLIEEGPMPWGFVAVNAVESGICAQFAEQPRNGKALTMEALGLYRLFRRNWGRSKWLPR